MQPNPEYRALGLSSRRMALGIAIVGLITSPAIIGIPLLIWGAVAEYMLVKHDRNSGINPTNDPHMAMPSKILPRATRLNFPDSDRK